MIRSTLLLFLLLLVNFVYADTSRVHNAYRLPRAIEHPVVDGELTDAIWNSAESADGFLQQSPNPGAPARQRTEVKVIYTDDAIYIAARMFDSSPDSILHQLSPRDEYQNNTDAFGILIDPYHDKRNGFFFAVTAAGVQTDSRYVFDKSDVSLNSVWFSKTMIDAQGWTAEIKIPYQAIRFPGEQKQVWGINYTRIIRRYREQSWWNTVDPNKAGIVNQCGDLAGIEDIQAPVRLALLPYVSGYYELYDGRSANSFNGGMDVKYGINESFTLDMTLIPDFGQTISDNLVLNLSPFEVRYDERRYFFTEGTELFNRNDLFYSRRIGARPRYFNSADDSLGVNEYVDENPLTTRLYNGIKISGRTLAKTGVGLFNAIAAPSFATIRDSVSETTREVETSPLSNYSVFVVEQILGQNSYIGYMNTLVLRAGTTDNAMVNSVQFRVAADQNRYAVEGYIDHSIVHGLSSNGDQGYRYHLEGGKIKGPFIAKFRHHLVSNTFDSNDLGYLDRNNYYNYGTTIGYNYFKPFGRFMWTINEVNVDLSFMYDANQRTFFSITGKHIYTFRNFLTCGINWLTNPIKNFDYFETRTPGRFLIYPKNYELGGFISSDYRKVLSLDASTSYRIFLERNRTIFKYAFAPRWRVNDKLFLVYRWEQELKNDNIGFVAREVDSDVVFGLRNLNTVTSTLTGTYIFTNRMGLSLRVRHYWSEVSYKDYFLLLENGGLAHYDYTGNANISFNAFNIDLIYTWQFLPGSELSIAWKNSVLSSGTTLYGSYIEDVDHMFDAPVSNSLSAKLIWYLDAGQYLKRKR
ncbi:MAG: carbohydrate binding family 9 domain-containing protein [Bacteroidia bacterium]|nr:carbohydrate binding family 9 domain-containing protein [Bacteroidia bacterium]